MKYPLTETAKVAAREIVAAWDAGHLGQKITLAIMRGDDQERVMIVNSPTHTSDFRSPLVATWWELSKFNLVAISEDGSWEILLLQELRNAVATDFEVSEYFLTLNAVGNIIVNSVTGPVQGVGQNTGVLHQTVEQLADYIGATLGREFLETQEELRISVEELRVAGAADQQSKLGKVISELGRCLEHGANAVAVVAALPAATAFLQSIM